MLRRANGIIQFDLSRCVQCGTCLAVCPQNALDQSLRDDGLWELAVNAEKCSRCFECIAVCPAHILPKKKIFRADLDKVIHLYLAHASDPEVRKKASSGGAARVLAGTALAVGLVTEVHAVAKTGRYPWAEGRWLAHPLDISQLANSMYLPFLANKNLGGANRGTVLLIGTTCQLLAAERCLRKKCERIYKIAIFCKQQKNLKSTCFMAKRLGLGPINRDDAQVEYRGGNWPGQVTINGKGMKWEAVAGLPYGKRLWRVPGCRLCPHPFGIGADLTLADPWGIDRAGEPGNTLIAVWTKKGDELLGSCRESLQIREIDKTLLPGSVTWKDIRRKRLLVDYYSGMKVPVNIRLGGLAERLQTASLETLLAHVGLPNFAYKVLGHLPDAADFFLKR